MSEIYYYPIFGINRQMEVKRSGSQPSFSVSEVALKFLNGSSRFDSNHQDRRSLMKNAGESFMRHIIHSTTTRTQGWQADCWNWAKARMAFELYGIQTHHLAFCRALSSDCRCSSIPASFMTRQWPCLSRRSPANTNVRHQQEMEIKCSGLQLSGKGSAD